MKNLIDQITFYPPPAHSFISGYIKSVLKNSAPPYTFIWRLIHKTMHVVSLNDLPCCHPHNL